MGKAELTPREHEVLAGIAEGLSNEGIAARCHLSVKTIERVISTVFDKLGLADEPQLNRRVRAATMFLGRRAGANDGGRSRGMGSLPAYRTAFHPSVADVVERLAGAMLPGRAVVLAGPGGVGKTRLAVEVAETAAQAFAEGVCFVDLVPATGRRSMLEVVAATLGVIGTHRNDPLDAIVGHCRDRDLLVVLDNAEHVSVPCAELVDAVNLGCPTVAVLVTSRMPLGLPAEVIHVVSPLDPGTTGLALLRDRIATRSEAGGGDSDSDSDSDSDDASLARLCEVVDGLPLGIELIAGRLRALAATEWSTDTAVLIRNRASRTPRHDSLSAAIDWSSRLLDPSVVELLDLLSVFPGSFDAAAVEAMAPTAAPGAALALFADLVDASLVMVDSARTSPRYRLLDTVRAVARARLGGREPVARDAHLRYVDQAAAEAGHLWDGPRQPDAVDWFETHWDDMRSAIDWAIGQRQFVRAEGLLQASRGFAISRIRDEHGSWTEALLAAAGDEPLVAARTLAATWTLLANDVPGAEAKAVRAIAAAPSPHHPSVAWATTHVVFARAGTGRHDEIVDELALLRRFATEHPDPVTRWQVVSTLSNLRLGFDTTNLRADLDELALLTEAIGSPELTVKGAVLQLQRFALGGADMVGLLDELERNTLPMARRSGALDAEAWCLNVLVTVGAMLGELRWAEAALSRLYELRYRPMVWMSAESIAAVLVARGEVEVPAIVLGHLDKHVPNDHEDPFAGRVAMRTVFADDPAANAFQAAGAAMSPGEVVALLLAHLRGAQAAST